MSIDWTALNNEQRQAVTELIRQSQLERFHRLAHIKALLAARATDVSWKVLGSAEGVSRETIRSRHKAAKGRKTDGH